MEEQLKSLPNAADWSLLVGKLGSGSVTGGMVFFILAFLLATFFKSESSKKWSSAFLALGCIALFTAIISLGVLFVTQQFQFDYVYGHSDPTMPVKYRIAAIWSAQQGSFLLWGVSSGIFGLLALRGTGPYQRAYVATFGLFLASVCGILRYESPFNLVPELIVDGVVKNPGIGSGMTPSLQNYWVIVHPPTIFLGFGSLAVMFAYGIAAMIIGDVKDYASRVRPWALASLSVLGLGIAMGGLWAYETQGWGGFWAWDPVENVSFVPWLFVATLSHGLIVQATRKKWHFTNLILAGLPFILFVYGTFLTRSGLLGNTSVHAFASMEKSAAKVLVWMLAIVVLGYAGLLAFRGWKLSKAERPTAADEPVLDRENTYRFGMLFVSLLSVVIAIGMSWPVITDLMHSRAAKVEEGLYHKVVVWFFFPIMLLIAVAPFIPWRKTTAKEVGAKVLNALSITIGLMGFSLILINNPTFGVQPDRSVKIPMPFGLSMPLIPWMFILVFICTFALVANIWRVFEVAKRAKLSIGGFVAHAGLAVLMGGLILSRGYERKEQILIQEGRPAQGLGYTVAYAGLSGKSVDDREGKALFDVTYPDGKVHRINPGLYYYKEGDQDKAMVWPHIERQLSHDLYFSLHTPILEAWEKPVMFAPGETKVVDDFKVTYNGMTMNGQPGTASAEFLANLSITLKGKTYEAAPSFRMSGDNDMPPVGNDFRVALQRIDAATKSAEIQIYFNKPIFPMEVFYKPMTGFVWLGTGILTLGGLMSAVARRRRPKQTTDVEVEVEDEPIRPVKENAPIPAPQS